jgi:hypothetical protein
MSEVNLRTVIIDKKASNLYQNEVFVICFTIQIDLVQLLLLVLKTIGGMIKVVNFSQKSTYFA